MISNETRNAIAVFRSTTGRTDLAQTVLWELETLDAKIEASLRQIEALALEVKTRDQFIEKLQSENLLLRDSVFARIRAWWKQHRRTSPIG